MKRTLLKNSILAIALLLTSAGLNAQSVLDAQVFGFELGSESTKANGDGAVTGCFIPTASQTFLTFSAEQKASGNTSLKLNGTSTTAVDYSVQLGNKTSLPASRTNITTAGKYDLKAKIYIVSNPPATIPFAFAIADAADESTLGNLYKNIVLTIPVGTPTGQWVELAALDTVLTTYANAKVTIKMSRTLEMATTGIATVIYLDDFTLTPSTASAVKNLYTLDAKLYFNQLNKTLTVNSISGSDVKIYNIAGSVVKSFNSVSTTFNTTIENLSTGLYFVKVSNKGASYIQKIQL